MKEFLLFLTMWSYSEAARILAFYPLSMKSHHYVIRPIIRGLAERGHEVLYVTGYPYEGSPPEGVEQMDLSQHMPKLHDQINVLEYTKDSDFGYLMRVYYFGLIIAPSFLGNRPVQNLIHSNETFDAVLMESYIIQEYQTAFIHKFNAVGIEVIPLGDSSWMNELSGLPVNPSYQLDFKAEVTQDMNFWQRLYNTYLTNLATFVGYYHLHKMQKIMDKYFNYTGWETRPPIGQLLSNRSLILTNSHFAVGYPVPLSSYRKEIGGVHIAPQNKPLPKSIQTFMDESENGVIYLSLGSNINVSNPINEKIHQAFMKVFEEIPQRVLMKWEAEYPGELPKNVKLEKWFPQQDILAHNNCVLFITHGGYLSLIEAVHFGVPVIGIPFFGDQPKNMHFADRTGIGKMLRLMDINYKTVSMTVNEVLSNSRYKDEVTRRSKILRDRLHNPADEAVYWIEHAIKYPNALTPKGASLSFIQLHLMDVTLFIVAALLVVVWALWELLAIAVRLCRRKPTSKKLKTN